MNKKKILWILPNFNFYNIQRLNLLISFFDILVIAGKRNDKLGFKSENVVSKNDVIYANKHKKSFGQSFQVMKLILKNLKNKDFVHLAVEKKNFFLLLVILTYKFLYNSKFQIFSYNHLSLKSENNSMPRINKWLTKFYFKTLDRIIFYTKESCELAIKNDMIDHKKAYWANNTVDTIEVKKYYNHELPPENDLRILFIGRLISSKRVKDLFKYYWELRKLLPNLKLEIIGDGPDSHVVKSAVKDNNGIIWHGALINEKKIAPIMKRVSVIFIPGHSGLSVNHAFAYGRPYITLSSISHAPEVSYIDVGKNGFILDNDFKENLMVIYNILKDRDLMVKFCEAAKKKGEQLSVEYWVIQIRNSLLDG